MDGNEEIQVSYAINELRAIRDLAHVALDADENTDIIASVLEKTLKALEENELPG